MHISVLLSAERRSRIATKETDRKEAQRLADEYEKTFQDKAEFEASTSGFGCSA
jgi:hypothetical protein